MAALVLEVSRVGVVNASIYTLRIGSTTGTYYPAKGLPGLKANHSTLIARVLPFVFSAQLDRRLHELLVH
jgi:hypothetical protein